MRSKLLFFIPLIVSTIAHTQGTSKPISFEDERFDVFVSNKNTKPKISGKLLNLTKEELNNTSIDYTIVTLLFKQIRKTTRPQSDGSFKLDLTNNFPYQQIFLNVGDTFFTSLLAHKDLYIELDMQKIKKYKVSFIGKGVHFLGSDGPMNVYLNNRIIYKREKWTLLSKELYELDRNRSLTNLEFLNQYEALYKKQTEIEEAYISENPSPYSWIIKNESLSRYYSTILVKHWSSELTDTLWKKIQKHKSYFVSNDGIAFYNYLVTYIKFTSTDKNKRKVTWQDVAKLPHLNSEELTYIDSLRTAENLYLGKDSFANKYPYSSENQLKWSKKLSSQFNMLLLKKTTEQAIVKIDSMFQPAKADFLKLQLNSSKDLSEQQYTINTAIGSMHTNWTKRFFKNEMATKIKELDEINTILRKSSSVSSPISLGKPVLETNFGSKLYEVSDMKVADFLTQLKKQFPGKAIVLDVWATWCAPCLSEMPYSKKLHEETKDMPIEFVYICTNNSSDKHKWKSKIAELKQPGIHYFIDDALTEELMKLFNFRGFPGYAFLDRKGVYIPGAFVRPSLTSKDEIVALLLDKK